MNFQSTRGAYHSEKQKERKRLNISLRSGFTDTILRDVYERDIMSLRVVSSFSEMER